MVLEGYRKKLDLFFDPLTRLFSRVHPNVFSTLSFVFAIIGGFFYTQSDLLAWDGPYEIWPFSLALALVFIGFNSIADTLDGRIARYTNTTSKTGDFLDHTFDRFSDVAILIGIAFSPYCNTTFGLITVVLVLLSSYMGTQAQALGCGRNYRGVMGRADRMVLLLFATIFQFTALAGWGVHGLWIEQLGIRIVPLELAMVMMFLGGLLTTFMRGVDTYRSLKDEEQKEMMEKEYRSSRRNGNSRVSPRSGRTR